MARVTTEDCVDKIPNRFELVMTAAQRARQIGSGAALTVDRDNDKNPVIALREVAAETVSIDDLQEELTKSHQRVIPMDDDDTEIDMMDGEEEWAKIASQSSPEGIYADDDVAPEDKEESAAEPSLEDLAGSAE